MKKRNLITVMMIIFTLALAGCGGSGSGSDDASEREEKVEEKVEEKNNGYINRSFEYPDTGETIHLYDDGTFKDETDSKFYTGIYEMTDDNEYKIYIDQNNMVGTFEIEDEELTLYLNEKSVTYYEIAD